MAEQKQQKKKVFGTVSDQDKLMLAQIMQQQNAFNQMLASVSMLLQTVNGARDQWWQNVRKKFNIPDELMGKLNFDGDTLDIYAMIPVEEPKKEETAGGEEGEGDGGAGDE